MNPRASLQIKAYTICNLDNLSGIIFLFRHELKELSYLPKYSFSDNLLDNAAVPFNHVVASVQSTFKFLSASKFIVAIISVRSSRLISAVKISSSRPLSTMTSPRGLTTSDLPELFAKTTKT